MLCTGNLDILHTLIGVLQRECGSELDQTGVRTLDDSGAGLGAILDHGERDGCSDLAKHSLQRAANVVGDILETRVQVTIVFFKL